MQANEIIEIVTFCFLQTLKISRTLSHNTPPPEKKAKPPPPKKKVTDMHIISDDMMIKQIARRD